jgi:Protein of unknown function (DUF3040)
VGEHPSPDRSRLTPGETVVLAEIADYLRAADPGFVARMSPPDDAGHESETPLPAAGALLALLVLALILTHVSPAVWPVLALLVAIHLLPVVLLRVVGRSDQGSGGHRGRRGDGGGADG